MAVPIPVIPPPPSVNRSASPVTTPPPQVGKAVDGFANSLIRRSAEPSLIPDLSAVLGLGLLVTRYAPAVIGSLGTTETPATPERSDSSNTETTVKQAGKGGSSTETRPVAQQPNTLSGGGANRQNQTKITPNDHQRRLCQTSCYRGD